MFVYKRHFKKFFVLLAYIYTCVSSLNYIWVYVCVCVCVCVCVYVCVCVCVCV